MLRWVLLIIGLALLTTGVLTHVETKRAEALVLEVDAPAALEVLSDGSGRFLRLDASLVEQDRVYLTGLRRPDFSRCSPSDVRALTCIERPDCFRGDVGCVVAARCMLMPEILSLRTAGAANVAESRRLLAPATGTSLRLWVLSPPFSADDDEAKSRWTRRERFVGRLTSFEDLVVNVPEISHTLDEVRGTFRDEFGSAFPASAWIILAETSVRSGASAGACIQPVVGGADALFVQFGLHRPSSPGEPVSGLLRAYDREQLQGLASALGRELPARIGIIERISTDELARATASRARIWIASGAVCIALGILVLVVKARRFRAERRASSASIDDVIARERIRREAALRAKRGRDALL